MADVDSPKDSRSSSIDAPPLDRQGSVLDEVEVKLTSVWATLRDKPNEEDLKYAEEEKDLYDGQLLPTRSEILTWYLYDWANSPMFNVVLGLVIPIYLSSLARHYGCDNETEYGCNWDNEPIQEDKDLVVYMGSLPLKPESFTSLMISLSGAMQAVAYIAVGALADYSYYQFYLFRICTVIASCMIFIYIFLGDPATYLFAGWWIAIQLVFFGLALIFYNAYLPQIVENHWIVRRVIRKKKPIDQICKIKQQISDDMSQYGFACGYLGSLFMTIIATAVFAFTETTEYEQLENYGATIGTSFDEQWLKPVDQIWMRFDSMNLIQIQLGYDNIDINGSIYGDPSTSNTLQTYNIPENGDYIISIDYWINTDKSIHSMRFNTKNGIISPIYGIATNGANPDQSAKSEEGDFIFSGYKVYINDNKVTGMEPIMLNEETGQFQSTWGPQIIMLLVCIWWNVFQFFSFKYFKRRDGPPLPSEASVFTFSIKQFYYAMRSATQYPHMFRYLLSWFCFSDGLNTLSVTAVLFATTELNMSSTEAALLVLEALFLGSWGGVFFLWLQRKILWSAKKMLLLHIFIFMALCIYTIVGLIPNAPFGLISKGELYIYVFVFGCNWGSIQSYARSVFSYLVPIGKESQMFALYEITDKGSSWIGPLMVALIANIASIRWGMFYVTTFFVVAAPLLIWGVDLQIGMKQAGRWKDIDVDLIGIEVTEDIKDNDNDNDNDNDKNDNNTKEVNTEMVDTNINGKSDNYHDPKVKIKVTSIDDDEENERKNKNDNNDNSNNKHSEQSPDSRTELIYDDDDNNNDENDANAANDENDKEDDNNNNNNDKENKTNINVIAEPIEKIHSSSDNEDEDTSQNKPKYNNNSPSVEEVEAEIELNPKLNPGDPGYIE